MLLRFLLNSGTNIETKSDMGNTALLYAAQVRRTLSHGMLTRRFLLIWRAFSLVTWTWCTSLFSAAATYTSQTVPIVYGRCMCYLFCSPGFFVASTRIVRLSSAAFAVHDGETILHKAASSGSLATVRVCLQAGTLARLNTITRTPRVL